MKLFRKKGANLPSDQTNTQVPNSSNSLNTVSESSPARSTQSPFINKKTITFFIIIAIVLVIGVLFGYKKLNKQAVSKVKLSTVCTGDYSGGIQKQALDNLQTTKLQQLGETVKKIELLKKYDQDPNCLMITTNYYVMTQDAKNARLNFDKLNKIFIAEKIDKAVASNPNIKGLPNLQVAIEFREQQNKRLSEDKSIGAGHNGP